MSIVAKIFIFVCGIIFVLVILDLLIKRRINERSSLIWLISSLVVLLLSASPDFLDNLAAIVGIEYPPALLFLVSTLILFYVLLTQSIQISIMNEKVRELTQKIAISESLDKENKL